MADHPERETWPTVEYSIGYAVTDKARDAIARVAKKAWQPAITTEGEARVDGDAAQDHRHA